MNRHLSPAGATVVSVSTYNADHTVSRRSWRVPACGHADQDGDTCPGLVESLVEAFGPPAVHEVIPADVAIEQARATVTTEFRIPDDTSGLTGSGPS